MLAASVATLLLLLSIAGSASAAAPVVSLTTPANGSYLKTATPLFAGTADTTSGDSAVTVAISASSDMSNPLQSPTASVDSSSGAYSVSSASLTDGTYYAQASQSDALNETGKSPVVQFTVKTIPPAVGLTDPPNNSTTNSPTPTFDGSAGIASGDLPTITVNIYPGTSPGSAPVQTLTTTASGSSYTVVPTNALADGTYTTQASQSDQAGNTGHSVPTTFTVDTAAPIVTLTDPTNGTTTNSAKPSFDGNAGTGTGDLPTITIDVYAGSSASGTPVETFTTTASGTSYSAPSAAALAPGTYTVEAFQSDQAGNVGHSSTNTFTVQSAPSAATENATGVTSDAADLNGIVNPNAADTTVYFQYGPTTSYGSQTANQNLGSGSSPTLANTSLSGLSPATTYHFRVVAVNTLGTSYGGDQTLTTAPAPVDQPPRAGFAPASGEFLTGRAVQFDASPSSDPDGTITGYSWNFGDKSTASGPTPTRAYAQPGTYTVTLTVTDNSGNAATVSHQITVLAPPPVQTLIETIAPAPQAIKSGPPSVTRAGLVDLGQRLFCPGDGPSCQTTITATSASLARDARAARRHRKRHVKSNPAAGSAMITIAPNGSSELTFRLSRSAMKALRQHKRLPLRVMIVSSRGAEETVSMVNLLLQLPAKRKH